MTSALMTPASDVAGAAQQRPTGAKLRKALSLRLRLALLVALSTAAVIGIEAYLEIRVFEREVERDLLETARLTALAVADDYELRVEPIDRAALAADLHEFVLTTPSLRTLSIVEVADDTPTVVASTSSEERSEALVLATRAVSEAATLSGSAPPGGAAVAVPVTRPGGARAAAVATVSLASLGQLRTKGRRVTLWFTPAAIIVLTLLVDWLGRRLIHKPIGNIRETMARAGQGDFTARTDVVRRDEIGTVAIGLNDMLRRLQDFNEALQERVDEATTELRMRNEELVETYQRVFALREAVARNEQLAAVGQMAASVAHQVGTPLNLISGYVQMLQEEAAAEPRTSRRLEIVQEQIDKVSTVVRTLLDHSRRPEERRAVDLSTLLARVAEVAGPKLDASGISLTLRVPADLPPIWADAAELELALLNLITNSLDAMSQGGTLGISATPSAQSVRIEISDTGIGIPADLLPRIFQPWVTTKPAGRGTGLGLSITEDVIARHGGTIHAASEPGRTTFTIELPLSQAAERHHAQDSDR
ncbi:MAG: two-component system, NtrC family, sensor kinase [Acidobacteriota bacterium]|jgi:signal transduction histidine kinase